MSENNRRAGFLSQWASDAYKRLGNVRDSADENILLGRMRREKILSSLAALEREKAREDKDSMPVHKWIDALREGIRVDLAWLNTHGFSASLDEGKLQIEGLDIDEE